MVIKILGSGSDGNSYVLIDKNNNQLLLECGLKFEKISQNIDFTKLDCLIISHFHKDHSLSKDKFENAFIDIYSPDNVENGKPIQIENWNILPIKMQHNVDCFGYIIHNKIENKIILFATDTTYIPTVADKPFDCMMLECNYNYNQLIENGMNGKLTNDGYKNHMALEDLVSWLSIRKNKPKNLIAIHISNENNLDVEFAKGELLKFADKLYIAKKEVVITI